MKKIISQLLQIFILLNSFNVFSQLVPLLKKNGLYAFTNYGNLKDLNFGVFEDALPINNYLIIAKKDNLWGALDLTGKPVIGFENLSIKDDGNFIICQKLIKAKDEFESNSIHHVILNFTDGVGFENDDEKIIRGFKNDTSRIYSFPDFSNTIGKETIEYLSYSKVNRNFFQVKYDASRLIEKYFDFEFWGKEKLLVNRNGMKGIIDINDKVIIPFRYTEIYFPKDELVKVHIGENTGFIKLNGDIQIPLQNNYFYADFSFGLCYSHDKKNHQSNGFFINKTGNLKFNIDERLESNFNFSEGLIFLSKKKVFINTSGNIVLKLPTSYIKSSNFIGNYAVVTNTNQKFNIIDKSGKLLFKQDYDDIYYYLSNNYSEEDFELGFIDSDEQDMSFSFNINSNKINFPSKKYTFANQELFKVERNGNKFFVDKNGLEYIEK